MSDYLLCGWRVRSELPLPELLPWTGDERAPEIHIREGAIPETLPDLVHSTPLLQIAADGTCRFALRRVGAYLVRRGCEVLVQPVVDKNAPELRTFLFGTVFGLLCYQRGLLPLHASCVRIGEEAVAFAGASGVGKSTLAAAFLKRGHDILADDITVVDVDRPGGPVVLPAFPRLKLWQDAMAVFDIDQSGVVPVRSELKKYAVPVEARFQATPLPLVAVYHLNTVRDPRHAEIRRLRGMEAVTSLHGDIYRMAKLAHMGERSATLATAIRLAAVLRGNWRLSRCHDHAAMDEIIADILTRQGAA